MKLLIDTDTVDVNAARKVLALLDDQRGLNTWIEMGGLQTTTIAVELYHVPNLLQRRFKNAFADSIPDITQKVRTQIEEDLKKALEEMNATVVRIAETNANQ